MRFYLDTSTKPDVFLIEHKGEVLDWDAFEPPTQWWGSIYKTAKTEDHAIAINELMFDINGYLASRPEEKQDALFECYRRILVLLDSARETAELSYALIPYVKELLDTFFNLDEITEFMTNEGSDYIRYPKTIEEVFDSNDGRHSENVTYTRREYFELVCLIIAFRSLLPIQCGYKAAIPSSESRDRVYNELDQIRMLMDSDICDHKYFLRLKTFVDGIYQKENKVSMLSAIVEGAGSCNIPTYLFASAIFNKLLYLPINIVIEDNETPVIEEVEDTEDETGVKKKKEKTETHIITSLYHKIKNDVGRLNKVVKTQVVARAQNRLGDEEDKIGYLESYSAKQKASNNVPITNQVYLYDYVAVAEEFLGDSLDRGILDTCYRNIHDNFDGIPILNGKRCPIHLTLTQWVLSPVVMMRALPSINRKAMLNAMALAQTILIHWGFEEIARLLSIQFTVEEDEGNIQIIPTSGISTEIKNNLESIYKFHKKFILPNGSDRNARMANGGIASVSTVCSMLIDFEFKVVANDDFKRLVNYKESDPAISLNTRQLLMRLLVRINDYKKEHPVC